MLASRPAFSARNLVVCWSTALPMRKSGKPGRYAADRVSKALRQIKRVHTVAVLDNATVAASNNLPVSIAVSQKPGRRRGLKASM